MANTPGAEPSNIGDTKTTPTVDFSAGPSNDDSPDLHRNTAGAWTAPAGPGDKAGANPDASLVSPTQNAPSEDPPAGSIYAALPVELRRTVVRSFAARVAGATDTSTALDNLFWPGTAASVWAALDRKNKSGDDYDFPSSGLNVWTLVFEHIKNRVFDTWAEVKYMRQTWYGGCAGFAVIWFDRVRTEATLSRLQMVSGATVARDETYSSAEHQKFGIWDPRNYFSDADCHTWRELGVLDKEGLHFCVATSDPTHDNIHIDWRDPAEGADASGKCKYDAGVSAAHILQAIAGAGVPTSPFDVAIDLVADAAQIQRIRALAKTVKPRQPDPDGGGVSNPPNFDLECDSVQKDLAVITPDWVTYRRGLACKGTAGRSQAQDLVNAHGKLSLLESEAKAWQ